VTPQAIETSYAGCRFRSRLEARWAVFLTAAGIGWQYEAQGYLCPSRLWRKETPPAPYLPDFWLPELGLHAEVKGSLTREQATVLLDVAAYLSSPGGGCGGGNDLIVLGPVPQPVFWMASAPVRLHMHKGSLGLSPWLGESSAHGSQDAVRIADDENGWLTGWDADSTATVLIDGCPADMTHPAAGRFTRHYAAARSARFEHGQSGPFRGGT
jgi:hypothetical protein